MPERHGLQYQGQLATGEHAWRIRPWVDSGVRKTATFHTRTKAIKAARIAADKEAQRLTTEYQQRTAHAGTVDQLLTDWLDDVSDDLSPRTVYGYRKHADTIREHLGDRIAADVTVNDIAAMYRAMREQGASQAARLEVHRKVDAAWKWGNRRGRIPVLPPLAEVKPNHKPPEIAPPSVELVMKMIYGLPDHEWSRAVAMLALCGMRRGEVVGLHWEDYDPPTIWVRRSVVWNADMSGRVVNETTKSKQHRQVTMPPRAVEFMETQRLFVEGEAQRLRRDVPVWVFPNWESWRWSEPRDPDTLSRNWNRYRGRFAGGRSVRLHDLRHFYATVALQMGAPVVDVAKQLGHTDSATTLRIYTHSTEDGRAKVAEIIGRVFGSEMPELPGTTHQGTP